jgi:predicted esterase
MFMNELVAALSGYALLLAFSPVAPAQQAGIEQRSKEWLGDGRNLQAVQPNADGDDLILPSGSPHRLAADGKTAPKPGLKSVDARIGSIVSEAISEKRSGQFIEAKYASGRGGSLPFRLFIPKNLVHDKSYPLLLFLHGAGELGDDNSRQLEGFPWKFASSESQAKHPCYIVAPQCPKSDAWSSFPEYPANARSSHSPTPAIRITIELIENLISECKIDKSRVYVTGLSLGGEGTFDIVSRRPDLFAAAVPVCGIADVEKVPKMTSVPFWIFHGELDEINPVKYSREVFQALKSKGATPIYTEYKDAGHDIWSRAYGDPSLIPWLFQQKK